MSSYNFIIADDEPRLRSGMVSYIKNNFPKVNITGEFEDGSEALDFIKSGEQIDVAILDIRMLSVSGLEVSQYIYDNRLPIKVIIITAYREFDYAVTAINQHVEAVILKPFSFEQLRETIEEVIARVDEARGKQEEQPLSADELSSKELYDRILEYINANFCEDIPLSSISNRFYMSESHFCRYFKKHSGTTFVAFLTDLRISKAKRLLKENVPLSEIGQMCGYSSYKHFAKRFKQCVGTTPKEYAQGHK